MFGKVDTLIETLIVTTKSGETIWLEKTSNISKPNRKFERLMSFVSNETTFNITIKYVVVNNSIELENSPSLFIFNKDLPGGTFCSNSKDVLILRDLISEMFCQDMKPNKKDLDDLFESIIKNISINRYRDNKLGGLLD